MSTEEKTQKKNKKIIVWHNLVYSTKGGCGKTTFCLNFPNLTISGLGKNKNPKSCLKFFGLESPPASDKVVILDLDLAASNLVESVDNGSVLQGIELWDTPVYLCDYLIKREKFNFVENFKGAQTGSFEKNTMLVMGPRDESERSYFKTKRRYIPTVRFEEFKYSILELINDIITKVNDSEVDNDVLNIVYDLPPNSDGFTEVLFDALLNQNNSGLITKSKDKKVENRFRLIMPTNPEVTIKKVNLSWLQAFLSGSGSNRRIDQILFLDNSALNKQNGNSSRKGSTLTAETDGKIRIEVKTYGPFVGYVFFDPKKSIPANEDKIFVYGRFDKLGSGNPTITLQQINEFQTY